MEINGKLLLNYYTKINGTTLLLTHNHRGDRDQWKAGRDVEIDQAAIRPVAINYR